MPRAPVYGMLPRAGRRGQSLSANGPFDPTNSAPATLEVLLDSAVVCLPNPVLHLPVELILALDAEVVAMAVRAEGFDLLDARIAGSLHVSWLCGADTRVRPYDL